MGLDAGSDLEGELGVTHPLEAFEDVELQVFRPALGEDQAVVHVLRGGEEARDVRIHRATAEGPCTTRHVERPALDARLVVDGNLAKVVTGEARRSLERGRTTLAAPATRRAGPGSRPPTTAVSGRVRVVAAPEQRRAGDAGKAQSGAAQECSAVRANTTHVTPVGVF